MKSHELPHHLHLRLWHHRALHHPQHLTRDSLLHVSEMFQAQSMGKHMSTVNVVPDGYTHSVDVPPVRVLFYPDTPPGIEHACKVLSGDTVICAPKLHPVAHTIVETDPLTIHPSILCPDCGLHGIITGGTWRPA